MTKWDYRIESTGVADATELNDWLDKLGSRGWELVTLVPDDGQAADAFPAYLAIFKRPDPTVSHPAGTVTHDHG